jgi:hypothetical protein
MAHAPTFVVGTGRSGTSLLRTMLDAHPELHLTHEASFYVDPLGGRLADDGAAWFERYQRSFSFAWLQVPPREVLADVDATDGGRAPTRADVVTAVMRVAAHRHGKERFGDKTPAHSQHLATIRAEHPDARIVHVVRDPREVVASLARMPWATGSTALNARFCAQQVEAVLDDPGEVCHVRLEDLVADPERELRRVLAHLDLPWDDGVLDHERRDPADLPPFPWFQDALQPVQPRPERPLDLSPTWLRIVERTNRRTMERFGYEPRVDGPEISIADRVRARIADLPEVGRAAGRGARVARLGLRRTLPPPDELQRAVLALNPTAWDALGGEVVPPVPPVPSR